MQLTPIPSLYSVIFAQKDDNLKIGPT